MNSPIRQAYLAGPYSDDCPAVRLVYIAQSCQASASMARLGFFPICPHASGDHRVSWEKAMTRCDEMVLSLRAGVDLMVMLPGWEKSRGAVIEKKWALDAGVEVRELHEMFPEVEGAEGHPA